MARIKHVLGIWVQPNRGLVLGLGMRRSGQPRRRGRPGRVLRRAERVSEAIAATWSQAAIQTCVVHLIRNALRFVSYGDRKAVATALKAGLHGAEHKAARRARCVRRDRAGHEELNVTRL